MKTYLVRMIADQTLMGVFCAESTSKLADIIDNVFDARECEYLELRPNEGLFIEAKFATIPTEDGDGKRVVLTHVDDPLNCNTVDEEDELLDEEPLLETELLIAIAEEDYVPPVLEPTYALNDRLQAAEVENEWQPVREGRQTAAFEVHMNQIDSESIARKLIQGALNPATFIKPPSNRIH